LGGAKAGFVTARGILEAVQRVVIAKSHTPLGMKPNGSGGEIGADRVFRNGAPRPMKMGTIASPWRYDAVFKITSEPEDV
jgi:hypothetical protein